MVDVGYFINRKHGVIRNVIPISNTKTEHLCFVQANGEEQYALKKEDIEYVIPSDINCVSGKIVFDKDGVTEYGADGSVVMKGRYVEDKPMTNAEKFKEVFGIEVNRNVVEDVCSAVLCDNFSNCDECPYRDRYNWDDPYVKAED
jgi:hypothetical protein